jgi:cation transport ATPase
MAISSKRGYFHAIDGRMRFAVEGVKGCPATAREVEGRLRLITGVHQVSANPKTGNVLVLYDSQETSHDAMVAQLRELGYLQQTQTGIKTHAAIHALAGGGGNGGQLARELAGIVACGLAEFAVKRALVALI